MPFGAHVMACLEEALSETFQYHDGLDSFLQRSGIPAQRLTAARARAEERSKTSRRAFQRAPKRFVAQEILKELGHGTSEDDRHLASIVTALCKGNFPEASAKARLAIEGLAEHQRAESGEAEARREEQRHKLREEERTREAAGAERTANREKFRNGSSCTCVSRVTHKQGAMHLKGS